MNDNAVKKAINQPFTLNNEATPDATIFAAAAPNATSASTSVIYPDAQFLSPGLKLDTELFSKGNIQNMDNKNTIDTNPSPYAPYADTPNASARDSGSTDSNSPYSLINRKFPPYSTDTMKNQKKKENKI